MSPDIAIGGALIFAAWVTALALLLRDHVKRRK